jgi:glycosyltransferase involved in cell wall biosynthesis
VGNLLRDAGRRRELSERSLERAALYTWDETAARTVAVYDALGTD